MQIDSCLRHDADVMMESIPESPSGSPVLYRGISHLEIPIGLPKRNRSYSGLDGVSNPMLTSSIQCHEARVLRLCNKKYPLLQLGDNTVSSEAEGELPNRFLMNGAGTTSRDLILGQCRASCDGSRKEEPRWLTTNYGTVRQRPSGSVDYDWSKVNYLDDDVEKEEDIKRAINWTKKQRFSIREDDRQLLRKFIEIRFKIESLGWQLQRWNRAVSLASCHDLASLATLPRSPASDVEGSRPHFRQRALSLRTPKIEYSPVILRHRKS